MAANVLATMGRLEGRNLGAFLVGEIGASSLVVRLDGFAPPPAGAPELVGLDPARVHAELGELVAGSKPGRTSPDQITLYKSVGVAVQDAAAAALVLAAAQGGKHVNGRRTWGHSMLIDPWGEIVSTLTIGPGIVVGDLVISGVDGTFRLNYLETNAKLDQMIEQRGLGIVYVPDHGSGRASGGGNWSGNGEAGAEAMRRLLDCAIWASTKVVGASNAPWLCPK